MGVGCDKMVSENYVRAQPSGLSVQDFTSLSKLGSSILDGRHWISMSHLALASASRLLRLFTRLFAHRGQRLAELGE